MSAIFGPACEADLKEAFFTHACSGYLKRRRPRLIPLEDLAMNLGLHRSLRSRGCKWMPRTGLNSWYVRHDAQVSVPLKGRLQFVRKQDLGLPFRHLREASRRLRHGTWLPGGKAGPAP